MYKMKQNTNKLQTKRNKGMAFPYQVVSALSGSVQGDSCGLTVSPLPLQPGEAVDLHGVLWRRVPPGHLPR